MADKKKPQLTVPEAILPGVYANQIVVRHTREEFVLDFVSRSPPSGVVAARVIVSPGHLKRVVRALNENVRRYATAHPAAHPAAAAPKPAPPPAAPAAPAQPLAQPPGPEETDPGAGGQGQASKTKGQKMGAVLTERVAHGAYANQMMVSHSQDEFLLDFISSFPPHHIVTARIFTGPAQIRRMIATFEESLRRYESAHGPIVEAMVPGPDTMLN
ncbi:MAG: DUF3467 domain-containing protein [bacterium]|nr:DUF3467 domain-containing protein [bacterium]